MKAKRTIKIFQLCPSISRFTFKVSQIFCPGFRWHQVPLGNVHPQVYQAHKQIYQSVDELQSFSFRGGIACCGWEDSCWTVLERRQKRRQGMMWKLLGLQQVYECGLGYGHNSPKQRIEEISLKYTKRR